MVRIAPYRDVFPPPSNVADEPAKTNLQWRGKENLENRKKNGTNDPEYQVIGSRRAVAPIECQVI